MYGTAIRPMRTRKIRNHDGAVVRVQRPSRQVEFRVALAEQTGRR